jgi:hypothetical protein
MVDVLIQANIIFQLLNYKTDVKGLKLRTKVSYLDSILKLTGKNWSYGILSYMGKQKRYSLEWMLVLALCTDALD